MTNNRRAAVSKNTIALLGVCVVAIAGIWGWQYASRVPDRGAPPSDDRVYNYECSSCQHAFTITHGELKAKPANEDGFIVCPKCGKQTARYAKAGSTVKTVQPGKP